MTDINVIRQKIESRLAYIQKEIDFCNADISNVFKHQHYCGYLQGLDGTFGEKQFLTKMLELIDEEEEHGYKF